MNDLDFMRNFCAEEAPPSAGRLAALRARVMAGFDEAPPGQQRVLRRAGRTRWRRAPGPVRLALTGAVAAMLAGAVAAAVIVPGAGARQAAGAVRLDAATVLHRAARAALAAPSPGANRFLYIYTVNNDPQAVPKEWVVREWINIKWSIKGYEGIAQWTSCGFKHDPGCWLPLAAVGGAPFSYDGVERLPTSARALLGYLDRQQDQACGELGGRMNQAEREWSGVYTILNNVPVLPPRFGAALFNTAAQIPGVRVIRNVRTAAGQPGIAVARTVPVKGAAALAKQAELIFSSRSYRYIGNVLDGSFTGNTRQSSALTTTGFTSTAPHHPRPHYGMVVWNCIGQVRSSGS